MKYEIQHKIWIAMKSISEFCLDFCASNHSTLSCTGSWKLRDRPPKEGNSFRVGRHQVREYAVRRYVVSGQKERLDLCWQTAPRAAFDTPGVCAFTALGLKPTPGIALGYLLINFPQVEYPRFIRKRNMRYLLPAQIFDVGTFEEKSSRCSLVFSNLLPQFLQKLSPVGMFG